MSEALIIGIAGGSASGKSTLAKRIAQEFENDVLILCHDDYYRAQDNVPAEVRAKTNYDHPDTFDTRLLIDHINLLKKGMAIEKPVYDYCIHTRSDKTVHTPPRKIIIIDGLQILCIPELRDMMDIRVYVDTPSDIRILRRLKRDTQQRGRTFDSVYSQYIKTVKPMHDIYVEPSKQFADIIVSGNGDNDVAFDLICCKIEKYLKEN